MFDSVIEGAPPAPPSPLAYQLSILYQKNTTKTIKSISSWESMQTYTKSKPQSNMVSIFLLARFILSTVGCYIGTRSWATEFTIVQYEYIWRQNEQQWNQNVWQRKKQKRQQHMQKKTYRHQKRYRCVIFAL